MSEAQTDAGAAAALFAYEKGWRKFSEEIVDTAKARGQIDPQTNGAVIIELIAGFAWQRLLTGRLEVADTDVEAVIATLVAATKKNPGG